MANLSVQLGGLKVGSCPLDIQQIAPIHKKSAETCLSKILSNQKIFPQKELSSFRLKLSEKQSTIQLDEREVPLEKSSELKRIQRIVRFYQHTGHFPQPKFKGEDGAFCQNATKKAVRAVNDASLPGTNGHVLAGMRIADDTLSITRNTMYAIPAIGANDPVANHLGYYAGLFWTYFSIRELKGGWEEYQRAKLVGDAEGYRRGQVGLVSGGICTTASLMYLSGRVCDTFESARAGAATLGMANTLFGVGSVLSMGASAVAAVRCHKFNERLNEYLENDRLTDVERLQGALQFLKESISVTVEEKAEITDQIEQQHPSWTPEQKEKFLQQKLVDLTEVKVKYMKRRTSNKSLYLILTQADPLLAKLADPEKQAEGIKEASLLLCTIQKENKTKMALYVLGIVASFISFLAMLLATFLTAGALPFVLYGISGTLYLSMSIYSAAGLVIKKGPPAASPPAPPNEVAAS